MQPAPASPLPRLLVGAVLGPALLFAAWCASVGAAVPLERAFALVLAYVPVHLVLVPAAWSWQPDDPHGYWRRCARLVAVQAALVPLLLGLLWVVDALWPGPSVALGLGVYALEPVAAGGVAMALARPSSSVGRSRRAAS